MKNSLEKASLHKKIEQEVAEKNTFYPFHLIIRVRLNKSLKSRMAFKLQSIIIRIHRLIFKKIEMSSVVLNSENNLSQCKKKLKYGI